MFDAGALIRQARQAPNRGRTHIFLGDPRSDGCDKTTVEPGNAYSPGVWTCGVSAWVRTGDAWLTPDLLGDDDVAWSFIREPGGAPVAEASYRAGPLAVTHRLCHVGAEGARGVDYSLLEVTASAACDATLAIVVKDVGPAGGKIGGLEWDADSRTLTVNGALRLVVEDVVDGCVIAPAEGQWDSPAAAVHMHVELAEGETHSVRFKTVHGFSDPPFSAELARCEPPSILSVRDGFAEAERRWQAALPAGVFAPDPRIALAWERCAYHIQAAMECCLPRIGAVNYPVFWIRDCVIVLRALDLTGRHDLARIGNEYLAPLYFGGGFGAESDAPGEGIWAMVAHARLSGDLGWLARRFGHVRERVAWLERMLHAAEPIHALSENRDPRHINAPSVNLLCLPAQEGLIHGRMDWHSPDFYVNCWAQCGLRLAADAARELGRPGLADRWGKEAARLDERIAERLLPTYGNPRDAIVTPHPTGALADFRAELRRAFAAWYRQNRLVPDGSRRPEEEWTYFEAAQAHNAVLLGLRDEAWVSLDGMLEPVGAWDVSAYAEGAPGGGECLPFRNDRGRRGWLSPERAMGGNMPHNWTSAEIIALIRDMFVVERDGRLVLGLGVPAAWMAAGARFGVSRMPTDMGEVSYEVTVGPDGSVHLDYHGPEPHEKAFPEPPAQGSGGPPS